MSALSLLQLFDNVIVKMGSKGCLLATSRKTDRIVWKVSHISALNIANVVDVTGLIIILTPGAGDSMVGVIIAGLSKCHPIDHTNLLHLVKAGMKAAAYTLQSPLAVSDKITPELLKPL
jgi:sugar/nucleoside kinase (ribokinase family)